MKITLVFPPIPTLTTSIAPPMGLAYIAAILKNKGAKVSVVSADAEGLSVENAIDTILRLSPEVIGISITTPTANNSLRIIRETKKKNTTLKIFAGGPHATLFPDEILGAGVDFVLRGESEITIAELYDALEGNADLEGIKGISYRCNKGIVHNADRELIDNLDSLPFPAWELFPVRSYKSDFRIKEFSLPVLSSRGCPAQCTFCYKGIFGDRFRVREPAKIVEEIERLKNEFHVEEFAIIDDSFTSKPKRAMDVCDLIVDRGINLPWSLPAGIRVPTVSRELLGKLKRAGCYRIGLGIESGNQEVLNSIKKGITLEQVRKAVKLLKESKVESAGYFMLGNLDETLDTMDQTINFALELDPDYAQFTKATPYPGTAMYKQLKTEKKIITDNWDDYDSFLKSRPVFTHKNLSSEMIDNKVKEAYKKFYYRPKQILKHAKAIRSFRECANFIKNACKFFTTYAT